MRWSNSKRTCDNAGRDSASCHFPEDYFTVSLIKLISRILTPIPALLFLGESLLLSGQAANPPQGQETIACDILIAGGGLSGAAAAYEALLTGKTVCMTEITDWVGGQISSQGTSALDEAKKQRSLLHFSRGYKLLRQNIYRFYRRQNPGACWVSEVCFLPRDGHQLLMWQLKEAETWGRGKLHWFPSTAIKELQYDDGGRLITGAIAIQHSPAPGTPPLNSEPLSRVIEDAYQYENSHRLRKKIVQFKPRQASSTSPQWFAIDATETGELIALAQVPYRLGLDPRSPYDPSSPSEKPDPYCTQGFTYTFAMEQTETAQPQTKPSFYDRYVPYYGYDPKRTLAYFDLLFTYRRIWSPQPGPLEKVGQFRVNIPQPGDISMQNWVWGNDYRPGTSKDNLILTPGQLQESGQLAPGGWRGGLRTSALRRGEELAWGFYYWLVAGNTDSRLGYGAKIPHPNHRFLAGLDSPMGTQHGLSKYPYMRESRRIIGRPSYNHPQGFAVHEIDISAKDYGQEPYISKLSGKFMQDLQRLIAYLESAGVGVKIASFYPSGNLTQRSHATAFADSVGISHYVMDFHPCMALSPPEKRGNRERDNVRLAHGYSYPAHIPLRALIPQKIDNLIVTGKNIAVSHVAAAAYRVHPFEWSVGAAAGAVASYGLARRIYPYQMVDDLPNREPQLQEFRSWLERNGNPTQFPKSLEHDGSWDQWTVW